MSYLLLFMFYANTKSLKDDIPGVPQGNVGSIMRSCDYPQYWCYFSLIYEHDVLLFYMKLTKLCLTDVWSSFLHHLVAHFAQQGQDSVLKFTGLTSNSFNSSTAKKCTAKKIAGAKHKLDFSTMIYNSWKPMQWVKG